jgi:hypothetical protein
VKIICFTSTVNDYAIKCLVELMRLSGKYRKGVARRESTDTIVGGTWDAVVLRGIVPTAHIIFEIKSTNLKDIYTEVHTKARNEGLI